MWKSKFLLFSLCLGAVSCTGKPSEQTVTVPEASASQTGTSQTSTSQADTSQVQAGSATSTSAPTTSAPVTSAPATASGMAGHDHGAGGPDLTGLQGEAFDRAFLSMMVAHHQGAVEMSRPALNSEDLQVRGWAEAIVMAQEREVEQMTALLEPLGGLDEAAAAPMRAEMQNMAGHTGHAANPDRAFVEAMLPHHQSAVDMAQLAEGRSQNADVLALAQDIVATQQREMAEFRDYLAQ